MVKNKGNMSAKTSKQSAQKSMAKYWKRYHELWSGWLVIRGNKTNIKYNKMFKHNIKIFDHWLYPQAHRVNSEPGVHNTATMLAHPWSNLFQSNVCFASFKLRASTRTWAREHERTTKHISHISRMELLHAMQVWCKNMGLARLNVIASWCYES